MAADRDWYRTFFRGLALDLWREAISPSQTEQEVEFLCQALHPPSGGELLDVPCGYGRHLIPLARRGYRMTGVDLCGPFLRQAEKEAARLALPVRLVKGDMADLQYQSTFHGAYCLGNSFGYLHPEGTRSFLRGLGRALKPGGRLVLETAMVAETILPLLEHQTWWQRGDLLLLVRNQYEPALSRLHSEYTFIRGRRRETRHAFHWVYTCRELLQLLEEADLQPLSLAASPSGEPFELGAEQLWLTARKLAPGSVPVQRSSAEGP